MGLRIKKKVVFVQSGLMVYRIEVGHSIKWTQDLRRAKTK